MSGGVAGHRILSLKALNLLIYPPVTGADQITQWLLGEKGQTEKHGVRVFHTQTRTHTRMYGREGSYSIYIYI